MIESAILLACLETDIDHELIRAIATQESAGVPTAFYINKWSMDQFKELSLEEAIMVSEKVIEDGFTVDVGLMGINSRNISRFELSVSQAFEPCMNIKLGERIISENIQHADDMGHSGVDSIKAALSMYNTGSLHRGFTNGYVDKVWSIYSASLALLANEGDINVAWKTSHTLNDVIRDTPAWTEKR